MCVTKGSGGQFIHHFNWKETIAALTLTDVYSCWLGSDLLMLLFFLKLSLSFLKVSFPLYLLEGSTGKRREELQTGVTHTRVCVCQVYQG